MKKNKLVYALNMVTTLALYLALPVFSGALANEYFDPGCENACQQSYNTSMYGLNLTGQQCASNAYSSYQECMYQVYDYGAYCLSWYGDPYYTTCSAWFSYFYNNCQNSYSIATQQCQSTYDFSAQDFAAIRDGCVYCCNNTCLSAEPGAAVFALSPTKRCSLGSPGLLFYFPDPHKPLGTSQPSIESRFAQ